MEKEAMTPNEKYLRNLTLLLVVCTLTVSILLLVALTELTALKREKEAHNWRYFTCRTLLDDPQTRATMDSKWRIEDAMLACKRATKKAAQQSTSSSIATSD